MDLISLWREMAKLRSDVGDNWKWPSPVDCVRFAFQELAEADDEMMRRESPDFLRRRDETGNSVNDELGMCSLMLLSYFRTEDEIRSGVVDSIGYSKSLIPNMSSCAMNLVIAWATTIMSPGIASGRVVYTLFVISEMMGGDQFTGSVLSAIAKVRARVAEKSSRKYKYLKEGAVACPYCDSDDLDTFDTLTDEVYHNRRIRCGSCGKEWLDVYKLVDVVMEA